MTNFFLNQSMGELLATFFMYSASVFLFYVAMRVISKGIFKSYYEEKQEKEKERKNGSR